MRLIITASLLASVFAAAGQTGDQRIEEARRLLIEGKLDQAITAYREVVRADPKSAIGLLGLAVAEYQAKRYPESIEHAEAALELKPELTPAYLFIGGSYLEMGEASKAVGPLEKAVSEMPGDRNAPLLLGEALLAMQRFEESLQHFLRGSELQPESPRVWCGLGQVYDGLANTLASEIRAAAPDSAPAYSVSADLDVLQGHFGRAFTAFHRALELDPSLPGIHAGLARVYRATGHVNWALEEERRELKPAKPDSTNRYAVYLSLRQLADKAYARLDQLPPSLERHLHRAKSLDSAGSHAEAAAEWREALAFAPNNVQVQLGRAWSLFRRREYQSALPILNVILKTKSDSIEANFLYGAALMNMEEPDRAIPYLRAAAVRDGHFIPALAALGQALLRLGKPAEAIPCLLAAIASDEEGAAHFQLVRAYQLTGQKDLAAKALADYQNFQAARDNALARDEDLSITPPVRE